MATEKDEALEEIEEVLYGKCVYDSACATNPCSGKTDGTACTVGGQSGICCDQDCKIGGNCCSDTYCTGYDPVTHTKIVCDCPSAGCSYPDPPRGNDDYTCRKLPTCANNAQCAPGWCCDTITGAWTCNSTGTILNVGGKSYLCDPPAWFSAETKSEVKTQSDSLLSLILEFFSNLFS